MRTPPYPDFTDMQSQFTSASIARGTSIRWRQYLRIDISMLRNCCVNDIKLEGRLAIIRGVKPDGKPDS